MPLLRFVLYYFGAALKNAANSYCGFAHLLKCHKRRLPSPAAGLSRQLGSDRGKHRAYLLPLYVTGFFLCVRRPLTPDRALTSLIAFAQPFPACLRVRSGLAVTSSKAGNYRDGAAKLSNKWPIVGRNNRDAIRPMTCDGMWCLSVGLVIDVKQIAYSYIHCIFSINNLCDE